MEGHHVVEHMVDDYASSCLFPFPRLRCVLCTILILSDSVAAELSQLRSCLS